MFDHQKSHTHVEWEKRKKKERKKISWSNGHTEKKVVDFLLKQIHFFTHVILFGDFCFSLPPSPSHRDIVGRKMMILTDSLFFKLSGKFCIGLKNFLKSVPSCGSFRADEEIYIYDLYTTSNGFFPSVFKFFRDSD